MTSLAVYTSWVSAVVTELIVRRGFTNANLLVAFTEPLQYDSGTVPPGYTQNSWYVATLTALHAQLTADGVRHLVRIMGPNDGGYDSPAVQQVREMSVCAGARSDVLPSPFLPPVPAGPAVRGRQPGQRDRRLLLAR